MGAEICFDGYLESVKSAYQQWWRLYTLTDATGRESQRVESDRPAFFDFGLMVQTVEPPKAEQERESEQDREKKEKIERLPVLEGICKYAAEHVLLVGRPGSGKSTALARLLLQEAENAIEDKQAKIPVLVELRYLPSEANESSVCDRILAFIGKHDPALDIDKAGIRQLLRQGRLLLLVDGVNELPSDRGRVMVNQFRELYQKTCPMIFTTRELSAGGDLGIAKRLEMQPLTEPQMQQFVMAYLPSQGERLLRQLSGRLREFGQTPLLLWMLCSLFQQSEQIPPNLGMVFRAFTVGYGDRIKQDVTLSKDSRAWWGRLLQYLAFKMTCGENLTELQVAISRRGAEQFLVEFLRGKVEFADDCAVRWLEDLLKHHLIQISNDRIEFRHQLIQEYYAAEWLLGLLPSLSDARLRQGYLNYLKWTEPLALMLELVEGEEQAVRVVRLALEVDLRLGARLAGEVRYGFQEKTVGLLIREMDERKIPKLYAIELLGETRSDKAVAPLILALKDSNYDVLSKASWALGNIGSEKAFNALVLALKDTDDYVRVNAAEILGNLAKEKAIESLIITLKDSDSCVRRKSAEALGKIGSDKAIESLIFALKDSDGDVRINAVKALGKIGSDKAIESLIFALKDSYYYVCRAAIESLSCINSQQVVDLLSINFKDSDKSDKNVRVNTIEVLGNIGSETAVELLISALKDSYRHVCIEALRALGKIGGERATKALIRNLKNSNDNVISSAAQALGNIGSEQAIDALIHALKDNCHKTRRNAAIALRNTGCDKAISALLFALSDYDSYVRRNAAIALGNIGGDKAITALIHTLSDGDNYVRRNVAEVLGNIGSDRAVDMLIHSLGDTDNSVRRSAAEALGNIGSDKAVEALLHTLSGLDDELRNNAVEALGKIGSDTAVDYLTLIIFMKGLDHNFRSKAVEALGNIGSEKAVGDLIILLKDPDYELRSKAVEALGKIGSEKAVQTFIYTLGEAYGGLCETEAKALVNIAKSDRNLPILTQQLPHLLTLIPTESSQQALSVITAIQARCKYYNYNIAQTPLQEENNNDKVLSNSQGNIIHMTEINNNFSNANFGGANIANLGGTVNEQKIVQKTEVPKQNLAEATKEIQELLNQLAKTNPSEATIADTIQQEIKRNPTLKARLVNALKTGGIEALKAIFNNPFVSIPVETIKGFLEAEE
ncbi:HEAT repeat domain-containing protein [Pseudanabaena galeata UHCC 0370]|uniref:HEAT repeat domain-containing protein n=1 Tax=Pseudanabaena galeata UHCC 0370 TaxID=3110310 RepID=A0ABU5THU7_9CYAN|nr:HEAT repeat domain-containing protein [Pseudanabaena galeata]MEA5477709.1 HEAT repeat domain-containing protein [Pseudanabaena galeata UHCC 0370]